MKYLATISILVILLVGTYTHISAQTKLINPHAPNTFLDMENNVKAWFGQKKIKKVVEKKRTIF